ncbi:MAG: UDP-glucose 4-epimerase GalE [Maricaulaceae bacterium]
MTEKSPKPIILVTGGAGYIGSHMCKTLFKAGYHPVTFDNLSAGHVTSVKWGPLVKGDVRNVLDLERAFKTYAPEAVIHFAARIEVGEGESNPFEFYDNNVVGTLTLLNTMKSFGVPKIVFSSTCATYGETQNMPLSEDEPQHPVSVYARTKYTSEGLLDSYHKAHGLRFAALRYFNAAGADLDGEIGEQHDPETHLIPNALKAAAGKGNPLKLFGTDYDTPDGTPLRDYIHVQDLANAHMLALKKLDEESALKLNLGTGQGSSVLDIINTIERVTGRKVPYDVAPRREGDVTRLYADVQKAKEVLEFTAQHSSLENIIKTAWDFHAKQWGIKT